MGRSILKSVLAVAIGGLMLGRWTGAAVPVAVAPPVAPTQVPVQPRVVPHVTPQRTAPREVPDVPEREAPERTAPQRNSSGHNSPQQKQNSSNPHLHGSAIHQDAKGRQADHADRIAMRLREDRERMHERAWHAWHHHWDYWIWYDWNLGRGAIEGNVRDASTGEPVVGAKVWLRDGAGHVMHYRVDQHIVRTNESGAFFMHHVRRGVYTVRAIHSGHQANADSVVSVHSGRVSMALIHM